MNAKDRRLGVGAGREAGMLKVNRYYDMLPPDEAYHIDCGGRLSYDNSGPPAIYEWECCRCHQKWESKLLRKMSEAQLEERFYMFPKPDDNTYVIVEDTDGFKTFTRTVTWREAREKKLKRIPDPTR